MNRTHRALRVLGAVSMPVLLLSACGEGNVDSAAGPTPAALRGEASKLVAALASHDYAAAYQVRSARCKLTLNQDDFVASMAQRYDGRDLTTKPSEVTVSTSGSTGTVTMTHFDARASEDDPKPTTWTFIDGQWRFDSC
ncbi:hypothetical protein AB0B25_19860 [Nocardia sp. NPDC049190]|uniref:hypothetical protein n=1 Tax=Nocardia sp. NPDC049190 TaxID=3155650 RepID=UPI0033EFE803